MKKESPYKDLAKKVLDMAMGDKITLRSDDPDDNKENSNINLSLDPNSEKRPEQPPLPFYKKIYNVLSSFVIIAAAIIGLVIPVIMCITYTVEYVKIVMQNVSVDINNIYGFLIVIKPIIQFYLTNILFTCIVLGITILAIITIWALTSLIEVIDYISLKSSIKKNYEKTSNRMKELDEEEERLKKESTKK
jgi:hypothetical protein